MGKKDLKVLKEQRTSCSEPAQQVVLGLGSNIGNRLEQLDSAVARLRGILDRLTVSSVYESEPMYVSDQPRFLNLVVAGCSVLEPRALLRRTAVIEADAGRRRDPAQVNGPRPLDIDILLYGDRVVDTDTLQIPHPRLHERRFVLQPLLEIAPSARDPRDGTPLAELLRRLPEQGVYCYRANPYNRARSKEQHT